MRDDYKDQKNSKLSKRDGKIEINIHMWLAYYLKSSMQITTYSHGAADIGTPCGQVAPQQQD